jgi:hypothetical protein
VDNLLNFLNFFFSTEVILLEGRIRDDLVKNFNIMNHQYLRIAKKIYNEEQSFPSVYRELIKDIEPDLAIIIIDELKKKMPSTKKNSLQLT